MIDFGTLTRRIPITRNERTGVAAPPKRAGGLVTSSFIEQLRYEFIEVRRDMIEC